MPKTARVISFGKADGSQGVYVDETKVVGKQEAAIASLTDSSGGTANNTVQAIGGSYSQSEVANNFADVTAKINAILTVLRNHGLIAT